MQEPDVTNSAHYRLFTDGVNNTIESNACDVAGGDDGIIQINSVSYDAPSRTITLNLNGGVLLPVDHYRLIVCSTLTDLSAQVLDGNRDGTPGDSYSKELYVDSAQSGPIFHVNQIEDVNDGSCGVLHCSLREAVIQANAYSGGGATIDIPSGVYTLAIYGFEDAAASGDLDITKTMTIYGAGADQTVLDGGYIDRVFQFRSGSVTLAGVTI
jgi:CSLREA domain-containing protein